jgi:hypothetical protein
MSSSWHVWIRIQISIQTRYLLRTQLANLEPCKCAAPTKGNRIPGLMAHEVWVRPRHGLCATVSHAHGTIVTRTPCDLESSATSYLTRAVTSPISHLVPDASATRFERPRMTCRICHLRMNAVIAAALPVGEGTDCLSLPAGPGNRTRDYSVGIDRAGRSPSRALTLVCGTHVG